jgi:hypothetical protein
MSTGGFNRSMQHQPQTCLQRFNSQKSFAAFDTNATPSWLGPYRLQPVTRVLHREVPSHQVIG